MQTYLVGGAVRDQLLGLPVFDRDWVVVGATAEAMTDRGFRQVAGGFPVFLHPDTGEEYALARREIKQAPGYRGFAVDVSVDVTLEEDLRRRDLTINAIAQADDGTLIDPFHGEQDLQARVLRHVSPAFVEDPVRVLRIARFAAYLGAANFQVASDTLTLIQQMVRSGELNSLQMERIWKEGLRALASDYPWRYFAVLEDCNALDVVNPLLAKSMGDDAMQSLRQAVNDGLDADLRWPVLMAGLPLDAAAAALMIEQLRVDKSSGELLLQLISAQPDYRQLEALSAEQLFDFCERYIHRFNVSDSNLIRACASLYPQLAKDNKHLLDQACAAAAQLNGQALLAEGLTGASLGNTLRTRRIAAIQRVMQTLNDNR